jgi:predicted amidohydrolase
MKIAIYQCEGVAGSKDENLKLLRKTALSAGAQGAQLLICSEMFLSGYNIGDAVFDLAEPADGPAFQSAAAIARDAGIALLYGYPERDGDLVYNSAILIDRKGKNLASYRKTHLYGPEENRLFQKGGGFVIADLDGVKIGILICYDVEFPEAVRTLALAGATLVAVPTAIMQPFCRTCRLLVPARAYENQIFVAYANRCGQEDELIYCGLSCIVGPDGKDRLRAGVDDELLVAEIDMSDIDISRQVNPYLTDLRPELYMPPQR